MKHGVQHGKNYDAEDTPVPIEYTHLRNKRSVQRSAECQAEAISSNDILVYEYKAKTPNEKLKQG